MVNACKISGAAIKMGRHNSEGTRSVWVRMVLHTSRYF